MKNDLYHQRSNNVFKTYALMAGFLIVVVAIGWGVSWYYNSPGILYAAVAFSIIMNVGSYWFSDKIALSMNGAKPATREEYFDLYTVTENLAITAGLPMPRIFVIEDPAPNAFATGRDEKHAVVAVTTGLLAILDRTELEGVIAHELAHIKNKDMLVMTVAVVLGLPMPLLPIHLLWINLVTDGIPALCLAADPVDPGVMQQPPRPRSERLANPRFLRTMALTGVLTAGVSFAVYYYMLSLGDVAMARTCAFAVLVFSELLRSFGARSQSKFVWRIPLRTNPALGVVVLLTIGVQFLSQHNALLGRFLKTSPVSFATGFWLLAAGLIPLVMLELVKVVREKMKANAPPNAVRALAR